MKTAFILIMAICLLLGMQLGTAAQAADETNPATSIGPGSLRVTKSTSWWDGLEESIRPTAENNTGSWLIDLTLYDENDRPVTESEMKMLSNYPARLSSTRLSGQLTHMDYNQLENYSVLIWIVPSELEACFLELGHLDWPEPHSDVIIVNEEGQALESRPPALNDAQKRELFTEALELSQRVELAGLRFYIHSARAHHAHIGLAWQARADIPAAADLTISGAPGNRQVADLTVYFPENE
jgi:hypothetical protein